MNSSSHVEDIVSGMKTFLDTNLGTYLTAVTTAKNDGITVADVDADDIILGAIDISGYDDYPVVFIVPIGEEYEPLTPSTDLMRATITVWLVVGGFAEASLYKMIWRYGSEIRNVIRDEPTMGAIVERSEVTEVAYFPMVNGEQELQAVRVTVVTEKEIS